MAECHYEELPRVHIDVRSALNYPPNGQSERRAILQTNDHLHNKKNSTPISAMPRTLVPKKEGTQGLAALPLSY